MFSFLAIAVTSEHVFKEISFQEGVSRMFAKEELQKAILLGNSTFNVIKK